MSGKSRSYSIEFKREIVKKMCLPGGPSALRLSREVGISQTTLSKWRRVYGKLLGMENERSTTKLSLEDQHKVVLEYRSLSSSEQGAYLRKKGLKSGDIERYELTILNALKSIGTGGSVGRPGKSKEVKELEQRLSETEKDLRFKEKALAEAAARVVLLKKSRLLFGLEDPEGSG